MAELDWYALKIQTRSEAVMPASLDYYGFESYCPQVKNRRQYSERLKLVTKSVVSIQHTYKSIALSILQPAVEKI